MPSDEPLEISSDSEPEHESRPKHPRWGDHFPPFSAKPTPKPTPKAYPFSSSPPCDGFGSGFDGKGKSYIGSLLTSLADRNLCPLEESSDSSSSDSDYEFDKPWEWEGYNFFADESDASGRTPFSYPSADPKFAREDFGQGGQGSNSSAPPPSSPPKAKPRPRPVNTNTSNAPFDLQRVSPEDVVAALKRCTSFERLIRTVLERLPHVNSANRRRYEDLDHSSRARLWRQVLLVCDPLLPMFYIGC